MINNLIRNRINFQKLELNTLFLCWSNIKPEAIIIMATMEVQLLTFDDIH